MESKKVQRRYFSTHSVVSKYSAASILSPNTPSTKATPDLPRPHSKGGIATIEDGGIRLVIQLFLSVKN